MASVEVLDLNSTLDNCSKVYHSSAPAQQYFEPSYLSQKQKFPCLGKISGLNPINVHAAGEIPA